MSNSEMSKFKENTRFDITAFGETMLRYSIPAGKRLVSSKTMDIHAGGAESNSLAALANIGRTCGWFGAVTDNSLGDFIIRELSANGINTQSVLRSQSRLGKYYVEFAEAPRPIDVIYDRQDAAITKLSIKDIKWDYLLDTKVLHLSGITPALSSSCNEIILEMVKQAKQHNVKVSFDVNYRSKLWSPEEASTTVKEIIKDVDLLICGEGDANTLFALQGSVKEILSGLASLSKAEHIVLTRSKAGSVTVINNEVVEVEARAAHIIDRLGAGDAFSAGLIDGFLDNDIIAGMKRGSVLSSLALSQHGDMVSTTRAEVEQLLNAQDTKLNR